MIITSHMQKNIQIHPCLLKLSRKQENVTDGRTDRRIFQPKTKIFPLLRIVSCLRDNFNKDG
jgi:hypothetical protein